VSEIAAKITSYEQVDIYLIDQFFPYLVILCKRHKIAFTGTIKFVDDVLI